MIKVHVVVKTIIIIYRSSVNNYTYRQKCFDQEAKPQIWVYERSSCFHKKTLRYTCSCKVRIEGPGIDAIKFKVPT